MTLTLCPHDGCNQPVVANHDELLCMIHGTLATPTRPWDAVSDEPDMQVTRKRRDGPHHGSNGRRPCPSCGRLVLKIEWASHMALLHGAFVQWPEVLA